MAIATVTIDAEKFLKKVGKLSNLRPVIQLSLQQSALTVQNTAKQLAPVLTGNLRRSITHEVKTDLARVGTDVIYARVREFNTKKIPKGYLRPALTRNRKKIRQIFEKNINNIINK